MEQNQVPSSADGAFASAREQDGDSILSEALLWHELRARPSGLRFNRRRATGKYIHDFYCPDARLAIELENEADVAAHAPANDQARDDWLARAGIATMRISASRMLDGSRLAASEIVSRAKGLLPQSHPALSLPGSAEPLANED